MKNFILFITIILCYSSLIYLDKTYITTGSKIFNFLSKDYSNEIVQSYLESQKKWSWVSYVTTPAIISIKISLVVFCLSFIKLTDLPGSDDIKFSEFILIALIAEFIFITAGFYKFVNFYWINTEYTIEDLQTYYPISMINLREYISTEKLIAYPLQLINLFELMYWGVLALGIREFSDHRISFIQSFGLTAITYGIGLLFWVGVVSFIILNAQY